MNQDILNIIFCENKLFKISMWNSMVVESDISIVKTYEMHLTIGMAIFLFHDLIALYSQVFSSPL